MVVKKRTAPCVEIDEREWRQTTPPTQTRLPTNRQLLPTDRFAIPGCHRQRQRNDEVV